MIQFSFLRNMLANTNITKHVISNDTMLCNLCAMCTTEWDPHNRYSIAHSLCYISRMHHHLSSDICLFQLLGMKYRKFDSTFKWTKDKVMFGLYSESVL